MSLPLNASVASSLQTIAVIGAGTMGIGIAEVAASAGLTVLLFDVNHEVANRSIATLHSRLRKRVQQGKADAQATENMLLRITLTQSLPELSTAQLVIEAVAEQLTIKQAIFGELEGICDENTIFASNTSSLSITAIGRQLKYPERLAGLHFFNPAPVMKLVEIIRGKETADIVIETLKTLTLSLGKVPVLCRSTPGFIVNRVARPFYAEALRALEEQIGTPATLDSAMRDAGGFSMGPLELTDLIGHDVNYAVTNAMFQAFGYDPRFQTSLVQQELVQAGHLGRKSNRGFYCYEQNTNDNQNNTQAQPLIAAKVEVNQKQTVKAQGDWQILPEFLLLLLQNEICIEEPKLGLSHSPTLIVNEVIIMLTNGELTSKHAQTMNKPVVQFDLSANYGRATAVTLSFATQNSQQQNQQAIAFFQALGKDVIVLPDYPALLTMRTVAMLCNEALDGVNKGIASAEDIDNAMRFGVNYPKGPLSWGAQLGWRRILSILEQLSLFYADSRYRPNPLLRQLAAGFQTLSFKESP